MAWASPTFIRGRDSSWLRVLAYHGVPDSERFRRQLTWLVSTFTPVTLEQVERHNRSRLPDRPVLVTFDDGDPTIVEVAMPVLAEFGLSGVAFVCPGLIDSTEPFWWEVLRRGGTDQSGDTGDLIARAKRLPDGERRALVESARRHHNIGSSRQLTTSQLLSWAEAGHSVGNHTWDHPVLDMCDPIEQERQIVSAHEWLVQVFGDVTSFAYPNGNRTDHAERTLGDLGYTSGFLFDHRLEESDVPHLQMSRIRVNAVDDLYEFQARVSGLHPALHRVKGGA